MTVDATVIIGNTADGPHAEPQSEAGTTPPAPRRTWTMPTSPVTRQQIDDVGRFAVKAGTGLAAGAARLVRSGVRGATRGWRAFDALPPALRLLAVLGVLALLGIVGSIALTDTPKLFCAIVVVPVCSIALGALGQRWVSSRDGHEDAEASELARSVAYVDNKLALALDAFGSERHQQAVIALVQAKTAVELALGAEGETTPQIGAPVPVDDYRPRPRIQAGSALAAS